MIIYVDSDYKCHLNNDGSMIEVESEFFNDKAQEFIEGYRCVPHGEKWTRADGKIFEGEMISPWKNYSELRDAQLIYEKELVMAALNILIGE